MVPRSQEKFSRAVLFSLQCQLVPWLCVSILSQQMDPFPMTCSKAFCWWWIMQPAPSLPGGDRQWNPPWFVLVGMESSPVVTWVHSQGLGLDKQAWWEGKVKNPTEELLTLWLPLTVVLFLPGGLWGPTELPRGWWQVASARHRQLRLFSWLQLLPQTLCLHSGLCLQQLDRAGEGLEGAAAEHTHLALLGFSHWDFCHLLRELYHSWFSPYQLKVSSSEIDIQIFSLI